MMNSLELAHSKTRLAYDLAAQKYHDHFHNEMHEKEYDRKLLDTFAERFTEASLICDAGCGPSGHIGRYLFDKGLKVIGLDISDRCIAMARDHNPDMQFEQGDIARSPFSAGSFDGIIAYYSIIHTPKRDTGIIFREFARILKPHGCLLVAVKAGTVEGYVTDLLGLKTELYFATFTEAEIALCFQEAGFLLEFMEKRKPYAFEISDERIFAIGTNLQGLTPNSAGASLT